jgi:zinc transport system substrate-binding protein
MIFDYAFIEFYEMFIRLFISLFCIISVFCYPEHIKPSPLVLVSIPPYLYFIREIAENTVSVESLVPPGVNPHLYEPTPKQVQLHRQAVLWFKLGEKADQKAQRVFQSSKAPPLIVDLTEGLNLLRSKEESCCSNQNTKDLHIWLSPKMMELQVEKITQALIQQFPAYTELYQNNANKLLEKLHEIDQELTIALRNKQGKAILASHPAFAYFCRDYQLEQLSLEEEGKDCLPRYIPVLVQKIKELKIGGIIIEPQHSSKAAKLIAQELEIPIYTIDPYAEDYIAGLQRIAEVVKNIVHD